MNYKEKNIGRLIQEVMHGLDKRQKDTLACRFGLNGKKATLNEIGVRYGITRERVRQVEHQIVQKIRPAAQNAFAGFVAGISKQMEAVGGVRREDKLLEDTAALLHGEKIQNEKVRFILAICGTPKFSKADDHFHPFWYISDAARKKTAETADAMVNRLKRIGKPLNKDDEILKDKRLMNAVSISRRMDFNAFGQFGLVEWPEVRPKTIRDKIYLILKKEEKVLHFAEIADKINQCRFDGKKAHIQTVHNELIKDDRFVLVGRGLYGLKEHGYENGTTGEVIARLLSRGKTLHAREIVSLVLKKKFVKHNTILLNLQNKTLFKRLNDGRYSLA